MDRIAKVTRFETCHYWDNDQTIAYCDWVDTSGKTGTITGNPDSAHMKALLARAEREGAIVRLWSK
jgi:hypothetical protein